MYGKVAGTRHWTTAQEGEWAGFLGINSGTGEGGGRGERTQISWTSKKVEGGLGQQAGKKEQKAQRDHDGEGRPKENRAKK